MNESIISELTCTLHRLNLDIRVLTAGTGPVVLMLHGNPDSADEWRKVMTQLSSQFRCIAPDFPGYGKSPRPPTSFTYDIPAQMAFVDALLTELNVSDPIILVVHDIGGFVATPWANANLERLKGIVFTNTVAYEGFEWFDTAKQWGNTSPIGKFLARLSMFIIGTNNGALFQKVFVKQSPQLSVDDIDRMTQQFAVNPNAKDATIRQFRHATRPDFFNSFDEMNNRITSSIPSQVVWGENDVYLDDKYAQRFGSAPVKMLPGVGHWVPIVAPNEVAKAVREVAADTE